MLVVGATERRLLMDNFRRVGLTSDVPSDFKSGSEYNGLKISEIAVPIKLTSNYNSHYFGITWSSFPEISMSSRKYILTPSGSIYDKIQYFNTAFYPEIVCISKTDNSDYYYMNSTRIVKLYLSQISYTDLYYFFLKNRSELYYYIWSFNFLGIYGTADSLPDDVYWKELKE